MSPHENQPQPDDAPVPPASGPESPESPTTPSLPETPSDRLRDSAWGSAFLSIGGVILVAGLLGALLMSLSLRVYESYGAVLFCLSPAICSFVAVILRNWRRPHREASIWSVSWAVVALMAMLTSMVALMMTKGEGLICVLMALPFAIGLSLIGGLLGQAVVEMGGARRPLPMLTVVILLYPTAQEYEARHPAPVLPQEVVTRLEVNAPPRAVWAALMHPVAYRAGGSWFRAGVVYPTRTSFALDSTTGRHTLVCRYSQGVARLPVVAWEPGHSLTFAVPPPSMPAPMHELSPYPSIHAPHLHGYFQVDSGTFQLRPLPGGRTLLEARTVYRHSIGPQLYWQLWSNYLLDAMHEQVLTTLKAQAETHAADE